LKVFQDIKDHFCQLHCHSEYSVRDALSKLDDLIERVKRTNNKYLSVTDHGNVASWAKLYKMCK
jgi:DNA polymerase III subunit alpha